MRSTSYSRAALPVVLSAVAAVVCLFVVRTGVQAQQQPPTFRGGVQSIEVDVRVTDRDGRPVRGLTADDFTLLDDGASQTITSATFVDLAVTSPVTRIPPGTPEPDIATNRGAGRMWVMLLGRNSLRSRLVVRRFIEEALGPNDEATVIHVGGNMSAAQGFTRSRRLLLASLDRIEEGERAVPGPIEDREKFEILEEICIRLGQVAGRRKSIVFFDPPSYFTPRVLDDVPVLFAQRDALRAATRNNVAIHVVSTSGLPGGVDGSSQGPPPKTDILVHQGGLRLLAEETGGETVINTNNFSEGYQRVVRDTNEYYLVAYTPTVEHRDGEFHRLAVRVNRPGVTVRARPGYYAPEAAAPGDTAPASPDAAPGGLSAEALEALRLPLSVAGIPLDVFVAPFRGTVAKTGAVLVGAHIAGADLALAPGEILEVGYRATDVEGKATPGAFTRFELVLKESRPAVESSGLRFVEWMSLPVGRHQVRFVASQPAGRTGMVVADVEVADFANDPVSLSGILLASDATAAHHTLKGDAALHKVLAADPTAVRRFSRRDTLTAYVEAYTNAGTSFRSLTGSVTRVGTTRNQPAEIQTVASERGRWAVTTRLRLNTLQPGDYVLAYEAVGGSRTAKRGVLFTVAND